MLKNKIDYLQELNKFSNHDNLIYLIDKYNDSCGLFLRNGKFLYMTKSVCDKNNSINTEFLSLYSHVTVAPISKDSQFLPGEYNIIEYKGQYNDNIFNTFLELCYLYSQNFSEVKFSEFFCSLVNLFQIPPDQQYKNFLGFYGEISFLIECLKHNKNFINNWHVGDNENSKYDFVFENFNADVKTILSRELIVRLKYDQLFNNDKNYLILIQLEKNNSGKTLNDLLMALKNIKSINNNYQFWLRIEKEKLRFSQRIVLEEKLVFKNINIYDASQIKPFSNIPENIMNLNFDIDLIEKERMTLNNFIETESI